MDRGWDVVVVGAGLAGLTAAATAAGAGATTLVLDSHQPGGRASTDERGRFRFNRGAHALYQGGAAEAKLRRLGVSVAGAAPPVTGARGRIGDRLEALPLGPWSLLRTRLVRARSKPALARMLAGVRRWRPEEAAGLTIGQWLDGFDLPDDARAFARLLVRTTSYLNDEDSVSADVPATQIPQALGAGVRYLHGGWASLVDALAGATRQRGAVVRAGAGVRGVVAGGDHWVVHGIGIEERARSVILASGTPMACASLLEEPPAAWSGLADPAEASCLDLGLPERLAHPILLGVDKPIYLIDHASTARGLAPDGGGLVHVLRYLELGEDVPSAVLRSQMEEHAQLAGIDLQRVEEQRFLRRPPGGGPGWTAPHRRPPGCGVMADRLRAVAAGEAPAGPADPVAVFTAERPRLVGVAYRITGSLADADDVVQEAWLRFERMGLAAIERPAAWLTTVVARLALDHLKAARRQREVYVGPWLPEPVASDPRSLGQPGPEEMAELAQSLTLGFLHMLETLGAVERVVFVLADVFDVPFPEIAEVVGKSPAACRQLASRARKRVRQAGSLTYRPPDENVARIVGELLAATTAGDMDQVVRLLSDDAVLVSDGGPHRRAARHPVRGAHRVSRLLVNIGRRYEQLTIEPVALNGELGLVVYRGGERAMAMALHVEDGRVRTIHTILNPEKLAALDSHVDLV